MYRQFLELPPHDYETFKDIAAPYTGVIIEIYNQESDRFLESLFFVLPEEFLLAKVHTSETQPYFKTHVGQFDCEDPKARFDAEGQFLLPMFSLLSKPFNIGIDRAWDQTGCERLIQLALKEKFEAEYHGWKFAGAPPIR